MLPVSNVIHKNEDTDGRLGGINANGTSKKHDFFRRGGLFLEYYIKAKFKKEPDQVGSTYSKLLKTGKVWNIKEFQKHWSDAITSILNDPDNGGLKSDLTYLAFQTAGETSPQLELLNAMQAAGETGAGEKCPPRLHAGTTSPEPGLDTESAPSEVVDLPVHPLTKHITELKYGVRLCYGLTQYPSDEAPISQVISDSQSTLDNYAKQNASMYIREKITGDQIPSDYWVPDPNWPQEGDETVKGFNMFEPPFVLDPTKITDGSIEGETLLMDSFVFPLITEEVDLLNTDGTLYNLADWEAIKEFNFEVDFHKKFREGLINAVKGPDSLKYRVLMEYVFSPSDYLYAIMFYNILHITKTSTGFRPSRSKRNKDPHYITDNIYPMYIYNGEWWVKNPDPMYEEGELDTWEKVMSKWTGSSWAGFPRTKHALKSAFILNKFAKDREASAEAATKAAEEAKSMDEEAEEEETTEKKKEDVDPCEW